MDLLQEKKHKEGFKDTGIQMMEHELDWRAGHTRFVAGNKPVHNWVIAGVKQIYLPGAESGHHFKFQFGEIINA